MAEITITSPIELSFSVIEADDRLPSLKTEILFIHKHPTGIVQYSASDKWFRCNEWDDFVEDLKEMVNNSRGKASLMDLDEFFVLKLSKSEQVYSFLIEIKETDLPDRLTNLRFESRISSDEVASLIRQWTEFPKWW